MTGRALAHDPHEAWLSGYDFGLPPGAIAQRPVEPRDAARLLVIARAGEPVVRAHARFRDLPELLAPGDLLVLNDTRVVPARLLGRKAPSGGQAELLLVRERGGGEWEALVRYTGRKHPGHEIALGEDFRAMLRAPLGGPAWCVAISGPGSFQAFVARTGHMPLPPYIRRPDDAQDRERYQTVFARVPGAVAAPTAGLHFTPELLDRLRAAGMALAWVTLHVGPGTFRPLTGSDLERGELHEEIFELPAATVAAVAAARAAKRRVVAVGTTVTRVLESSAQGEGHVRACAGATRLFIRPPYVPLAVDGLVTNFHLPRSSLLMLVAAFAGRERILEAYRAALAGGYRFYSYGDATLVL